MESPSPARPPRGKLPYIEDNGRIISDSRFIKRYLVENLWCGLLRRLRREDPDDGLLAERTLEESSYFFAVERRWIRPDGWR